MSLKLWKLTFASLTLIFAAVGTNAFADDAMTNEGLLSGWTGDIFAGYSKSVGNTQKSAGNLSASALKKFDKSQFSLKGNLFYSESNKSMDTQKWDILAKFSHDFGTDDNWFSVTQILVDHDNFSDIDYRITTSDSLGYHIFKGEDFTWAADAGLGYRLTSHRVNEAADDEALLLFCWP